MYKSETITRPDGTKYVQCTRLPKTELQRLHQYHCDRKLKQMQEQTARAIEAFGTSA